MKLRDFAKVADGFFVTDGYVVFACSEDLTRIICKRGIDKDSIRFAPIMMVKALESERG